MPNAVVWDSSETRSAVFFLVAGVLLVGHAAIWGIQTFSDGRPPMGLFAALGPLIAWIALVTLYPTLTDRIPAFSTAIVLVAAIPVVGWFISTAEHLVEIAGILPPRAIPLPSVFSVVVLVSTITAYVLVPVACRRAGFSRSCSPLLLAPVILPVNCITAQFVIESPDSIGFLFVVGMPPPC